MRPEDTTVVIQGYGNVGSWAGRLFAELGCRIVGVSDAHGAVRSERGLDAHALAEHVAAGGKVHEYEADGAEPISHEELLALECDVLVPAALGGAIHEGNADAVKARVIVEGANAPTTPHADEILGDRGVTLVPDVLANAGGVVVSYFEWVQNLQHHAWEEENVNQQLGAIMSRAYREVAARAQENGTPMRVASYEVGIERVLEAARLRGYLPS
jgi:glutamate dehydrogenase (NAD(P)+)